MWDKESSYNLVLGVDENLRSSGAAQLLMWEAIKLASDHVKSFNFEGSMLPHVEPVFRHFGGRRVPYFRVFKDKNKAVKLMRLILGK